MDGPALRRGPKAPHARPADAPRSVGGPGRGLRGRMPVAGKAGLEQGL